MKKNFVDLNKRRSGKAAMPMVIAMGSVVLLGPVIGPDAAFLVGMTLGRMLFPTENKTEMPEVANFPIQRSDKGTPVPVVYGTRKVAGNIVWMGPLTSYTTESSGSGGGGKGGGGGGAETGEVRYRISLLISVCHGPAEIIKSWAGKHDVELSSFTLFNGDDNGDSINALTGEDYSHYRNVCCAFANDFDLGTSTSVPNFTFEAAAGRYDEIFP